MTEVIPGIYQLQLPMLGNPVGYVNAYLVQGDNEYLLVDTGWNTEEVFDSLKEQLAGIYVNLKDISQIVATHIHPDHYGLAGRLKQHSQVKIALHYLEKELISSRYINMDKLLQQEDDWLRINGVPANVLPELHAATSAIRKLVIPTLPDITLQGGETISTGFFSFKVLWVPGHSPGHIALYEPIQKVLISGDHVLPTIAPYIGLQLQSGSNPLGDYINSLNAVKQLDVNLILPGHGNPFTGLQLRVEELIQHHKQRNLAIRQSLRAKPKTAYQISAGIRRRSDSELGWQNLPPLNKRLAIMATLAHLESMRVDGKVSKFNRDNTIYYQST